MSSFGRGRGILPNKHAVASPTLLNAKNGLVSNHTNSLPIVAKTMLATSPVPHSLGTITENSSKIPNLHNFGETLLSLKEEDSLFPIILDIINSPHCNVETVERMLQIIIDRCMWLPLISRKFADLLPFLTSHKSFGKEIKCFTFNSLQVFYEDRNSLRKYGDNAFRNAVILTGEVYYRYRVGSSGYKILGVAVLNYLKTLADSVRDDDLLTLAQQLSWSGKDMAEIDESTMTQLMLTVRRNLTVNSAAYSEAGRWYLLLCLELHFQSYDILSEELKRFYCNNLGEEAFASVKPPPLVEDNHLEYYNSIRKFFS